MTDTDKGVELQRALETIVAEAKPIAWAVAVEDGESGFRFASHGEHLFHAASTIKVAILLALYRAFDEGRMRPDDPLHVRNRFRSVIDGSPYSLEADGDGYPQLYKSVGRTATLADLAEKMIISSSNLATNLLFDHLGIEYATGVLHEAGVAGVHLRRGVGDELAFENGVSNETTAQGLLQLFSVLRGEFLSPASRDAVIHILLRQRFSSMIPAGLPAHATAAHKTGEISTVCHDAGIVYLPEREPYLVAILTEAKGDADARRATVAKISKAVYQTVTGKKEGK